jgi:hypothetical protein
MDIKLNKIFVNWVITTELGSETTTAENQDGETETISAGKQKHYFQGFMAPAQIPGQEHMDRGAREMINKLKGVVNNIWTPYIALSTRYTYAQAEQYLNAMGAGKEACKIENYYTCLELLQTS